jgi:hypothetical protein
VRKVFEWIEAGTQKTAALWLFEKALMLWLLGNVLYHLPLKGIFWGNDALFNLAQKNTGIVQNIYYVLTFNRNLDDWVFGVHIVGILWALIGWKGWIAKPFVYLTGYMLYYSAYFAFNSGFLLCLLWTFFLIPLQLSSKSRSADVINNLVLIACVAQFMLVYLIAGFTKWSGIDWLEGSGLYYALHLEHYSPDWVRNMFLGSTGLLMILSYFALIYQTAFPFLIWVKRIKIPLLIAGCLFHLGIAIMLNLWDFGLAMIVGYTLFLEERWAARFLRILPKRLLGKKVAERVA